MSLSRTIGFLAFLSLAGAACGGVGFDPPEKVKSLRVLAMQKSLPYAKPGETVDVKLLFWDGKASNGSARDIQVAFVPCFNPLGDLYYNCFAGLGDGGPGGIGRDGGAFADVVDATSDVTDAAIAGGDGPASDASDLADGPIAETGTMDAGVTGV